MNSPRVSGNNKPIREIRVKTGSTSGSREEVCSPTASPFRSAARNTTHFDFVRNAIMAKDMIAADMLMLRDISMAPAPRCASALMPTIK